MNVSNGQARTASQSSVRQSTPAVDQSELSNDQISDTGASASYTKVARQDQSANQCLSDEPSSTDLLRNQPSAVDTLTSTSSALDRLISEPSVRGALPSQVGTNPAVAVPVVIPDQDTSNVPSLIGDAAAGFQGASEFARDAVNRSGTRAAARMLTNGAGGNLPAPGIGTRSDLATLISGRGVTAAEAIKLTPFSGNASSTQLLRNAADNARKLNGVGRLAGLGLQPAIGAVQGVQQAPAGASLGEHIASTVSGSIKEFDDVGISYSAGFLASAVTTATVVGAPAAPAAGIAAGIAAGRFWDGNEFDGAFDNTVDTYITPALTKVIDEHITPAAKTISNNLEQVWSNLSAWTKQ